MTAVPASVPGPERPIPAAELPALIEDPAFLAVTGRAELLDAMAACWPDGVPAGTLAEDIHHLERLGVRPPRERHGDWLAWLHLLLVSHGRPDDAAALAAAGPPLPWRTVWSRWVPPGARAACRAPGGRTTGLRVVEHGGEPVALVREEFVLARLERWEPDDEEAYYECAVRLGSGAVLAGPRLFRPYDEEEDGLAEDCGTVLPEGLAELGEPVAADGPGFALPAAPGLVDLTVRVGRLTVLGGGWGSFVVESVESVESAESAESGGSVGSTAHGDGEPGQATVISDPVTRLAPAGLPREARAPEREWLARCFGADALWRAAPAELPAGLSHAPTRRFLTEVGFPAVRHRLLGISSSTLAERGLVELRTADLHAPDAPELAGLGEHAYVLATDNNGNTLIAVDGATGRVLRYETERWEGDYYAGATASSAERLAGLLGLYATWYRGADPAELADAGRRLRDWAVELDPATDSSGFWYEIFQDREDFV